jgi:N-acetylmuramoyl-L-alanine amidase|tara:strand:+ start:1164 stop:2375 length:1212 start_codon:yes stop_codon:yes gene_type:complete
VRLFKFFLLIFLAISPASFAKNKINEISFINDKIIIKANKNIDSKSFILENPPRIVVDLDKSILANKFKKNFTDNNFKKFRYSTSNSKLRLVFDLKNNITISKVISKKADNNFQIEVNLANSNYQKEVIDSKSQIDFANFVYDKVEKLDNKEQKFNSNKVKKSKISSQIIHDKNYNTKKYKPIIVIDPGHGGKDPGAIGRYNKTREKDITLSYSIELYKQLKDTKKFRVYLTRSDDRFIRLKNRVAIARRKKADLFISIHANASLNNKISGFSIYTLSEKSSDRQAAMLARKENRSDIISGVNFSGASSEIVKMMIAMSQRDSMNKSAKFAKFSVKSMQNHNINILKNAHRFAGFAVLTAPDMISVLIELGYLTNYREEKNLNSYRYRKKIVRSLVNAIEQYF